MVTSPLGLMPSQLASVSLLNLIVVLPVFLTITSYSTVWPVSAVSSLVVYLLSPLSRCCFSIVNDGLGGSLAFTTTSLDVSVLEAPVIVAVLPYLPVVVRTWWQV